MIALPARRGRPARHIHIIKSTQEKDTRAAEAGGIEARLVDARELAQLLSVTPRAVQAWARAGVIPSIRIGYGARPVLRFRVSDVLAVVTRRGKDSTP